MLPASCWLLTNLGWTVPDQNIYIQYVKATPCAQVADANAEVGGCFPCSLSSAALCGLGRCHCFHGNHRPLGARCHRVVIDADVISSDPDRNNAVCWTHHRDDELVSHVDALWQSRIPLVSGSGLCCAAGLTRCLWRQRERLNCCEDSQWSRSCLSQRSCSTRGLPSRSRSVVQRNWSNTSR